MNEQVDSLREQYPRGTRIVLISMNDTQSPPEGTYGTVMGVDDIGTVHVRWANGSTLGVIPGEDQIKKA